MNSEQKNRKLELEKIVSNMSLVINGDYGDLSTSKKQPIRCSRCRERDDLSDQLIHFHLKSVDLGNLFKIKLNYEHKSIKHQENWFLKYITVFYEKVEFYFPCKKWIKVDKEQRKVELRLHEQKSDKNRTLSFLSHRLLLKQNDQNDKVKKNNDSYNKDSFADSDLDGSISSKSEASPRLRKNNSLRDSSWDRKDDKRKSHNFERPESRFKVNKSPRDKDSYSSFESLSSSPRTPKSAHRSVSPPPSLIRNQSLNLDLRKTTTPTPRSDEKRSVVFTDYKGQKLSDRYNEKPSNFEWNKSDKKEKSKTRIENIYDFDNNRSNDRFFKIDPFKAKNGRSNGDFYADDFRTDKSDNAF